MDPLWLLISCSWKAAVLVALAVLFLHLAPRAPAAERRAVWAAVVVALLTLPLFSVVWSRIPLILPANGAMERTLAVADGITVITVVAGDEGRAAFGLGMLLFIWAAGAAAMLVRIAAGHARVAAYLRDARDFPVPLSGAWDAKIPVSCSPAAPVPMVVGLWRPKILLPADAVEWDTEQLHRVLAHEAAHLRCHDSRWKLLSSLAVALYWFHPLAWLAANRFDAEREHACDDAVLAMGSVPSRYASDLIDFARSAAACRIPESAIPMASPSRLEARIAAILDQTKTRQPLRRNIVMSYTIVLALLLLPLSAVQSFARTVSSEELRAEMQQTLDKRRETTVPDAPSINSLNTVRAQPVAQEAEIPKRIRIGGGVADTKVLRKVQPVYPQSAKEEKVQGTVRLNILIDKEGNVVETEVESSPDDRLSQSSVDAVSQWIYSPTLLNGEPVEVVTVVDINFTLK